jgi:hypothetical protein
MTHVIGLTVLHYGKPYLDAAIRSVIDSVDLHYVIYTPVGSHGHRSNAACPDSRDELYAIARQAAGDKLRWHEGVFPHEGAQRDAILQLAPDADAVVVVDSDEIYPPNTIDRLIEQTKTWHRRAIRLPFVHFWRSFYRAVLHDPAYPVRLIYPHVRDGEETAPTRPVAHMGYAIPVDLMRYKWEIHGHKNELRRDVNYFRDVYEANRQYDCHPVGSDYWTPEPVNPLDYMPDWMREHPYFNLEVIP